MEHDVEYDDDVCSNDVLPKDESCVNNQSAGGGEEYLNEYKNEKILNQWCESTRNFEPVSLVAVPLINSSVRARIDRITECISNHKRSDRTHVNKMMVALWVKEDLANRTVTKFSRPQVQEGIDEPPRPLTPEKFDFMRGEVDISLD